jgi:tRNA A37 threonylcarbamoyladenosine modification protein TsaB
VSEQQVDILVISLTSPLRIGIYQKNRLIESFQSGEKTSEVLPELMDHILQKYRPVRLFFARGPGSFMAIKITYLFLRTLSITLDLPLLATDGFAFNQNAPIKATGSLYFSKENGKITTRKIDTEKEKIHTFALPEMLDETIFSDETEPLYILPAV